MQTKIKEYSRRRETTAEELITQDEAAAELQTFAVVSFLVIADAEAFTSNLLRVIFLDEDANVVWHTRIRAYRLYKIRTCWRVLHLRMIEAEWWEKAVVGECFIGEKYLLDGEIGRRLYNIEGTPRSEPLG